MGLCKCVAAAVVLAAAHPAWAACDTGGFDRDAIHAARVRDGATQVNFIKDAALAPGCPNASPACRARAYVVPGDVVLVTGMQGAYACAAITNPRGMTTTGLLPAAAVMVMPDTPTSASGWTGHWTASEQSITISPGRAGVLDIKGDATWGAQDPDRVRRGGVNTGEIGGAARPVGGVLSFTMGTDRTLPYDAGDATDCRAWMVRRGPYLVMQDNSSCGGMNVTFSGLYRRQ